jgi:hypothetical protein
MMKRICRAGHIVALPPPGFFPIQYRPSRTLAADERRQRSWRRAVRELETRTIVPQCASSDLPADPLNVAEPAPAR